MKFLLLYLIVLIIGSITLGFYLKRHLVPAFTDDNCIRAIVGEYAVENDYTTMKLIAHAIRNRKTLKGVYGFYAKHSNKESRSIWVTAACAWFDSKN